MNDSSATTQRAKIEAMLAQQPNDQFLRYMLAMELEKEGQHELSGQRFRELMSGSPPHVPSFLMAAQSLVAQQEYEQAHAVLRDGIEVARQQGESHAAGEMAELLQNLGSMGE